MFSFICLHDIIVLKFIKLYSELTDEDICAEIAVWSIFAQ